MSMTVRVRWTGRVPEDLAFRVRKKIVEAADVSGEEIRDRLKEQTPVRTGRMRSSERYARTVSGDLVRLRFTAHTPYAPFVVYGARPHIIRPRAARALHWVNDSGEHFASIVHHPGNKPNDFPQRVLDEYRPTLMSHLADKIGEALRGEG